MLNITWHIKTFQQLTTNELYDILKLRIDVFVVEQACPYPDLDNLDKHPKTLHLFGYHDKKIVSYLRVLPENTSYTEYISIGRVVISEDVRGKRLGHLMLEKALEVCELTYQNKPIKISAQAHLEGYYQQHGFKRVTDIYLEDNIPHVAMILHARH